MTVVGDGKINTHPCTPAEEARNLQILQNVVNNVTNLLDDDGKVLVSSDDQVRDYLYPTMTTQATRDANADALIAAEIGSPGADEKLTLFLDSDGGNLAATYNDVGIWVLAIDGGDLKWYDASTFTGGGGGGGDDVLVKVSGNDTTSEYLHSSMKDPGVYASGTDILVMAAITNGSANEKLRLFFRLDTSFFSSLFSNLNLAGLYYDSGSLGLSFTMVRGQVTTPVTADMATFEISSIVPLGNGRVPNDDPLTVYNTQQEAFQDGTWVTAIYNEPDNNWQLLLVERYRFIRGKTTGAILDSSMTFSITLNYFPVALTRAAIRLAPAKRLRSPEPRTFLSKLMRILPQFGTSTIGRC